MRSTKLKSYEDLPLTLTVAEVGEALGISWYNLSQCVSTSGVQPGDSHGPNGPRNDKFWAVSNSIYLEAG